MGLLKLAFRKKVQNGEGAQSEKIFIIWITGRKSFCQVFFTRYNIKYLKRPFFSMLYIITQRGEIFCPSLYRPKTKK